jgi:Fic family protein
MSHPFLPMSHRGISIHRRAAAGAIQRFGFGRLSRILNRRYCLTAPEGKPQTRGRRSRQPKINHEAHRDLYYARLREISRAGVWTAWIEFFLDAIVEQSTANSERVRGILALYGRMKQQIASLTRSHHSVKVLDAIFDRPIFQSGDFIQRLGIARQTALPFLRKRIVLRG